MADKLEQGDGPGRGNNVLYTLVLKEFAGKEAFWTGQEPFQSAVTCHFKDTDMDIPLSSALKTYVLKNVLDAADGVNHLKIRGNDDGDDMRRVKLEDPLKVLFESNDEVTLYLHFGSILDEDGVKAQKMDQDFRMGMKVFEEVFKIPGFMQSKQGIKVAQLLIEIEATHEDDVASGEYREKLQSLSKTVMEALREHRRVKTARLGIGNNRGLLMSLAYGALVIATVAYFLYMN